MKTQIWSLLILGAFCVSSCGKFNSGGIVRAPAASKSSLKIGLSMKNAPSDVASIIGVLSREGYDTLRSAFTISDDFATCSFTQIAVGTWHLQVSAYNSSNVMTYFGSTEVEVLPGQTTPVSLTLNPATGSISITVTWGGQDTSSTDMALLFDGQSGEVVFPVSRSLQPQQLTIEMKVLLQDTSNSVVPFLAPTGIDLWNSADGYCVLFMKGSGGPGFSFSKGVSSTEGIGTTGPLYNPPLNTWISLGCTYDGHYMCFYINGQMAVKQADTTSIYYGDHGFSLGRAFQSYFGGSFYLKGAFDELRIWNYARTQSEIDSTLNKELSGHEAGLVGYWNFNQNSSDTEVLDRTDNGNNGQMIGGVRFVPADSL